MAWGRGFFRLWMVIAALWVAFALLVQGATVLNPSVPPKIIATPTGGTIQLLDRYGAQQREFETGVAAGALLSTQITGGDYLLYTRSDIEPARLVERVAEAREVVSSYIATETIARRNSAIIPLLALAFMPPLTLLILGVAIAWALAGFRQKS